ncbi:MAG: hypothetical protein ACKPDI_17485 [Actinomycetota bacterium]
MDRRNFLSVLIGTPALAALIAACGDNTVQTGDSTIPDTPTTLSGISHPTGADEVLLRIGYEGGFVSPDMLFARIPTMLVTGDGRAIVQGVMPAIYPGPLLTPLFQRTVDEVGVQAILSLAREKGLLAAAPDYAVPPEGPMVADAPDTVVEIAANGTTYVHRAYALGIDGTNSTPARDALNAFVMAISDLAAVVGSEHIGAGSLFAPTSFRVRATPVDPAQFTEPSPTIREWPADTGIVLAQASDCALVDAAKVTALFTESNMLTFFTEADAGGATVTYQLAVVQVLPGDRTDC